MTVKLVPPKSIGLKKALDLLRLPDHRLMLMHTRDSPNGKSFYVVPGGYIKPGEAEKILARPDVISMEDGLFPGCAQTWTIARGEAAE